MDARTLRTMQQLAQEVWRHDPALVNTDASAGELAWSWASEVAVPGLVYKHRLWVENGSAAAWGYIVPPQMMTITPHRTELSDASLIWQTHPNRAELLDDALDWLEAEVPDATRRATARAADKTALACLRAHGYAYDPSAPWHLLTARELDDIEQPVLPGGYSLKTMDEIGGVSRRVAVHRAAWDRSTVTEEGYAAVMRTWPYRADLDFVVEAPDGSVAASALGWYDDANRTGQFEPVGDPPRSPATGPRARSCCSACSASATPAPRTPSSPVAATTTIPRRNSSTNRLAFARSRETCPSSSGRADRPGCGPLASRTGFATLHRSPVRLPRKEHR